MDAQFDLLPRIDRESDGRFIPVSSVETIRVNRFAVGAGLPFAVGAAAALWKFPLKQIFRKVRPKNIRGIGSNSCIF